jgi:hypothetical protein
MHYFRTHAKYPAHLLDLIVIIIFAAEYKLWSNYKIFSSLLFFPLGSKYPPQHSLLRHSQSMFFPYCHKPSFTPIQNYRKNRSFLQFNYYVFKQQTRRQNGLNWMAASITKIQSALNFVTKKKIWSVTVLRYLNFATFSVDLIAFWWWDNIFVYLVFSLFISRPAC